MKKNLSFLFCAILLTSIQTNAQEVKSNEATLKFYGFIRNYFTFDSRESKSGTDELYYYLPLDESIQADGTDINEHSTTKWTAITSRLGLDVKGYEIGKLKVSAKIEADFYSGLSGVTGTAGFRLRQAYSLMQWKDKNEHSYGLKIGQAWHPMAIDMIHGTSLEIGVPFAPSSRTPQVTFDFTPKEKFTFTASALWQMQYTSGGPEGASANYIKYSNIPEGYLGVSFQDKGFQSKVGVDVLSIKPRYKGSKTIEQNGSNISCVTTVSDRLTTVSPFVFLQYKKGNFGIKAKSIYAESGEHMNLNGGYGVTAKYEALNEDGHWEYTPTRVSSSWLSLSYGKKWQCILFAGYAKNFGTKDALLEDAGYQGYAKVSDNYLSKNTYANVNSMWRVSPEIVYNLGKLMLALEWQITSVEYGKFYNYNGVSYVKASNGLANEDLHWITNHRIQMMVKYSF